MSCCDSCGFKELIIGAPFSNVFKSDKPLVKIDGVDVVDMSAWSVSLQLIKSSAVVYTVAGRWLSAVAPIAFLLQENNTVIWKAGEYSCRLVLTSPDNRVFPNDIGTLQVVK